MAKLKTTEVTTESKIPVAKEQIFPLGVNFTQEDLNKLVDKINEIILLLNKVV